MDRSVDSIGSCSLDVDADSSDISDASATVQILVNEINREFSTNLQRGPDMSTNNKQTSGQQPRQVNKYSESVGDVIESQFHEENLSPDKKPSYLNLACCVNGYSNLTTYDSKIRQDINKSREVSPIRPSSNSMQYCKLSNAPVPPVLIPMPTNTIKSCNGKDHNGTEANNNHRKNKSQDVNYEPEEPRLSFVQQRVERLYGPGALAQNFYSPRKVRGSNTVRKGDALEIDKTDPPSELQLKFQELSPSKDKKIRRTTIVDSTKRPVVVSTEIQNSENNGVDLPVFRHLSLEFRAQLPKVSPKKNGTYSSPSNKKSNGIESDATHDRSQINSDEVDHKTVTLNVNEGDLINNIKMQHLEKNNKDEKDGKYFLILLKNQESRILSLADTAEKYLESLSDKPEISEDILGLLRSASGKARLLVSQKMKQFEGLCHNNLKSTPGEKFPTTADDLQGFWDMVYLQIDHIDSIFSEIEVLKANEWKKPEKAPLPTETSKQNKTTRAKTMKPKLAVSNGNMKTQTQSEISLKREAQRKQLLEMKRKSKMALTNNGGHEANSSSLDPLHKKQTNG